MLADLARVAPHLFKTSLARARSRRWDEIRQRMSGRLGVTPAKAREAGEHGLCFGEVDIADLAAVAAVPPERCPLEPGRVNVVGFLSGAAFLQLLAQGGNGLAEVLGGLFLFILSSASRKQEGKGEPLRSFDSCRDL